MCGRVLSFNRLSLMSATGKRTLAEYQPGALGEFLSSAASSPPNKKKRAKVDHPFAVAVGNSSSDSSESDSDEEDEDSRLGHGCGASKKMIVGGGSWIFTWKIWS